MAGERRSGGGKWTGGRRRRTNVEVEGAREAAAIVAILGRDLRAGRQRRHLTQAAVGARIGVSRTRYGDMERGRGAGSPIGLWIAAAMAVGRPLAITASRNVEPEQRTAAHLSAQECVLRRATRNGVTGLFELQTRPAPNANYIDVCLRDDRRRTLSVNEIWNLLDDIGAGSRSFKRKLAEAHELAVVAGGDGEPYRVTGCWIFLATAANRALLLRYAAIFASLFPGSSRDWARSLNTGSEPPTEPGLVWIDLAGSRIFEARLGRGGVSRPTLR
jgi:transcriptional regulator with XRE-family HTH domain